MAAGEKVRKEEFGEEIFEEGGEVTSGENVTPIRPVEPVEPVGARQLAMDFVRDLFHLAQSEFELAKSEMNEKVDQAQNGIKEMIVGGAVIFFGGQVLAAALVLLLATAMEPWIAALIVGAVICGIGVALIGGGRKNVSTDQLVPRATIRSLREDQHAAQEVVNHARNR